MKLDEITAQVRFMGRRQIETEKDLHRTAAEINQKIEEIAEERRRLRNEIRRVDSQDKAGDLKAEISERSSRLAELRKERKLCEQIAERSKIMKQNLEQISKEKEAEKRKELDRNERCR